MGVSAQMPVQDRFAGLFSNAKHITKINSTHYIQNEQPQVVIHSIHEVVEAVRNLRSWRRSETNPAPNGKNREILGRSSQTISMMLVGAWDLDC